MQSFKADLSAYSHVAWVPCITGRLFFRHACCGMGARPLVVNYVSRHGTTRQRHVLVASTVDWRDVSTDAQGRPTTGRYRVILMTRFLSGSTAITGDVCLLPVRLAPTVYAGIDRQIGEIRQAIGRREDLQQRMEALKRSLRELTAARRHSPQKIVHFRLERNGIALLRLKAADIYDADTEHAALRAAYYYLKNTWHVHKHHHPKDESLTTIHALRADADAALVDMLDDLKESAVAKHRNAHPTDAGSVNQARGIVTYAQSLARTLANIGVLRNRQLQHETAYLENLAGSLAITYETHQRHALQRRHASDRFRNYLLLLLAVLAPLTLMYRNAVLESLESAGHSLGSNIVVRLFANFFGSDVRVLTGIAVLPGLYLLFVGITGRRFRARIAQRKVFRWWVDRVAPHRVTALAIAVGLIAGGSLLVLVSLLLLSR